MESLQNFRWGEAAHESIEELWHKITCAISELEATKEANRLEEKLAEAELQYLQDLLEVTRKERDEALQQFQTLKRSSLFQVPTADLEPTSENASRHHLHSYASSASCNLPSVPNYKNMASRCIGMACCGSPSYTSSASQCQQKCQKDVVDMLAREVHDSIVDAAAAPLPLDAFWFAENKNQNHLKMTSLHHCEQKPVDMSSKHLRRSSSWGPGSLQRQSSVISTAASPYPSAAARTPHSSVKKEVGTPSATKIHSSPSLSSGSSSCVISSSRNEGKAAARCMHQDSPSLESPPLMMQANNIQASTSSSPPPPSRASLPSSSASSYASAVVTCEEQQPSNASSSFGDENSKLTPRVPFTASSNKSMAVSNTSSNPCISAPSSVMAAATSQTASSAMFSHRTQAASEANTLDSLVTSLPEKGELLEAVIKAGPVLQQLFIIGPLPEWNIPPPMMDIHFLSDFVV